MDNSMSLSNGLTIPRVGLGTFPMKGQVLTDSVMNAYKCGYRLIDTADNYFNEVDLGNSLHSLYRETGAKREEIFIVSKVSDELYPQTSLGGAANKGKFFWKNSIEMQHPNAVHKVVRMKIEESLRNLKTDYLDLYLIHWPYPDFFQEIWYELEGLYHEGIVRSIGVCNCRERHIEILKKNCSIIPMVNQFETSPLNTKQSLVNYCQDNEIRVMVYSPLMSLRQKQSLRYAEFVGELSRKYGKTPSQICLRFNVQRGLIPIPKSSNFNRLENNISIFDFELSDMDMSSLLGFNVDYQFLPESKYCPGL